MSPGFSQSDFTLSQQHNAKPYARFKDFFFAESWTLCVDTLPKTRSYTSVYLQGFHLHVRQLDHLALLDSTAIDWLDGVKELICSLSASFPIWAVWELQVGSTRFHAIAS